MCYPFHVLFCCIRKISLLWFYSRFLVVFLIFFFPSILFASSGNRSVIHVVSSVNEVGDVFRALTSDSFVMVDVDATITYHEDPYMQTHVIGEHRELYDELISSLTCDQVYYLNHLWCCDPQKILMEEEFPAVISNLQRRSIPIVACTAAKMGGISADLPSFPAWRRDELGKFGIDFSDIFPGSILFDHHDDFAGNHPGIEAGVVYSGQKIKKGVILPDVLAVLGCGNCPKPFVVIDDSMSQIESIKESFLNMYPGEEFIGIHYRRIDVFEKPVIDLDVFREKIKSLVSKTKALNLG